MEATSTQPWDAAYMEIVTNALLSRRAYSAITSTTGAINRDLETECGYPKTEELTVEDHYRPAYDRNPIAARVVDLMPNETWRVHPEVYEDEDVETTTAFEDALESVGQGLREDSAYRVDSGSPLWEIVSRADRLCGIGHFGLIYLGLDDGEQNLSNPVEPKDGMRLLFARCFDESEAQVVQWETDPTSPRFGQPVRYSISFAVPAGTNAQSTQDRVVHWTRCVHIVDTLNSSEIYHVPRMRPVYNRLVDVDTLYGASKEGYWKGAFPGLALETPPNLGTSVEVDQSAITSQMEDYTDGLRRWLALVGLQAKSLAPQVVDPSPLINTQLEAICVQLGVPKRVFTGSERGELASSQDRENWQRKIQYRQNNVATPRMIVPVIDRLVSLGVLPRPEQYFVRWNEIDPMTMEEKAVYTQRIVDALAKYVAGDVQEVMSPADLFTRILGMDGNTVDQIMEEATGIDTTPADLTRIEDTEDDIEVDLDPPDA